MGNWGNIKTANEKTNYSVSTCLNITGAEEKVSNENELVWVFIVSPFS